MKEESLENFKNIESLEMDINNKKCKSVPIYKNKKFIVFISLIFICITIGVIILLLNKRKSKNNKNENENEYICEIGEEEKCKICDESRKFCLYCNDGYFIPYNDTKKEYCRKCSIDNCKECSVFDQCISCNNNLVPIYNKNGWVTFRNYTCITGENEKCHTCDKEKNQCSSCNKLYKLLNGECIENYSLKAIYNIDSINETINLINNSYFENIKEITIDDDEKKPCTNYTFNSTRNHTVYILLDTLDIFSLNKLFSDMKNLISISFTSNLFTRKLIDISEMYSGCDSLNSIYMSKFDTENVIYMNKTFFGCSSLKYFNFYKMNTKNVKYMDSMFNGCSSLTSIDLSGLDSGEVVDMKTMFYLCSSLKFIDLSSLNTSKVKLLYSMFHGCYSLESINLNNFKTNEATSINGMFLNCHSLTSINLSYFDTRKVKNMGFLFTNCASLVSLNLSNFDTIILQLWIVCLEDAFL